MPADGVAHWREMHWDDFLFTEGDAYYHFNCFWQAFVIHIYVDAFQRVIQLWLDNFLWFWTINVEA